MVDERGWSQVGQVEREDAHPAGEHQRVVRVADAVRTLAEVGRLDAAIRLGEDMLRQPMPEALAAELRCTVAALLLAAGRAGEAVAVAGRVLAWRGLPAPLYRLAAASRVFGLFLCDEPRARELAASMVAGTDPTDPARERGGGIGDRSGFGAADTVTAATVVSVLCWHRGELAEGLRWGARAVRAASRVTAPGWRGFPMLALAAELADLHEFDQAEALVRVAENAADPLGVTGHTAGPAIVRARLLARTNRLDEARRAAEAGVRVATEHGAGLMVPLAHAVLAATALRCGEVGVAAEHVERYRAELAAGRAVLPSPQYDWVELRVAAERDGPRRARELLAARFADLPTRRVLFVEEPGAGAWLVRLALATGDLPLAESVVATTERLAEDNPGFATVSAGARQAREALRDARPGAAGPATSAVPRREASGEGWDLLSDTERRIADLVGQGLTNRQVAARVFLSPHTVNYHLRQIFRKLDVRSRVELARFTRDR
ncbi:regulatory protein, luxR family [Streptoalloteichus tenebrarius]|uniref:Regulatory protein, luxR family n=1 Tax=Streptoalloteichus tenebrarius (strain ATCC 17920 / DSM 40477 / JCM 4838 / CBS 697.72 / NBRC 16177 / NCIMB 11028 / NRRL B-12390 / A12253. 1 / ISP 5477) TaxID=1933 RepID=A0ABT1HWY3_STRSD|nr:helix-turn-helix transcriptional regulator [Streptoalloteichus tenebrarius]MCP2260038.1 regulatory protein, luxR family [Streptoalloteichus tenebrarius]